MPVVCEQEFGWLFESLWAESLDPHSRNPSPLIDIMLELYIQYGHTFLKDQRAAIAWIRRVPSITTEPAQN